MLIQLSEDWIVSISEISSARIFSSGELGEYVAIELKDDSREILLSNKNNSLWKHLLENCARLEDAEPLD